MGDAFQAIMPLEDTSSVYALMYPDSVNPTATQTTGADFMTLLMSHIQSTMGFDTPMGEAAQVPFQMPEWDLETHELLTELTDTQHELNGVVNGTLPFMEIPGSSEALFQSTGAFATENAEEVAALVDAPVSAFTDLGVPHTGVFDTMNFTSHENGLTTLDVPSRNDSFAVETQQIPVAIQNNIPRFIFDSIGTETGSNAYADTVLGESTGETALVTDQDNDLVQQMNQLFESVIPQERDVGQLEELTLRDEVHLKSLEPSDMMMSEPLSFQETDLVLASNRAPETLVLETIREGVVEDFKLPQEIAEKLMPEKEPQTSFEERSTEHANAEFMTDFDGDEMAETDQEEADADSFKEFVKTEESKQSEKSAYAMTLANETDMRVRQAKEAQAISQQIVKAASFKNGVNGTEFSITLEPDYLGQLRMKVSSDKDVVSAKIFTESAYTKNVLLDNLAVLKESLDSAGVQYDEIEIISDDAEADIDFNFQESGEQLEAKTSSNQSSTDSFELPDYQEIIEGLNENADKTVESLQQAVRVDNANNTINYLA